MGFIKSLFEPPRNKIWSSVARDIGGEYIDGGFGRSKAVSYRHHEWEILLDSYTVSSRYSWNTYTRMRAPFMSKGNLLFKIYRNAQIIDVGEMHDIKLIQVGDPFLDEQFVIKGNQPQTVQRLLQCPALNQLLNKQRSVHFEIRDDEAIFLKNFPEGVDQLYFQVAEDILNKQRLKNLIELFSVTLDRLVQIDSAYETTPGFSYRQGS